MAFRRGGVRKKRKYTWRRAGRILRPHVPTVDKHQGRLMASDLEGKAVLITGASTGIGAAAARAFARQGSRVAVHYNASRDAAEKVATDVRALGGEAFLVGGDVTDCGASRRRGGSDRLRGCQGVHLDRHAWVGQGGRG